MNRLKGILFMIGVLIAMSSTGQDFMVKEYDEQGGVIGINRISNGLPDMINCSFDSNIWDFHNDNFYVITEEGKISVINANCEVIDTYSFSQNVIDFVIKKDVLIASISNDDFEYYESSIMMLDLNTKKITKLGIPKEGVKFGLSISNDAKLLSFVHQSVDNSTQTIKIYNISTQQTTSIQTIDLSEGYFGHVELPTNSDWFNHHLYYSSNSNENNRYQISVYDINSQKQSTFNDYENISQQIKVDKRGCVIALKRNDFRFNEIVELDTQSGTEKVLYASRNNFSDLDSFIIQN